MSQKTFHKNFRIFSSLSTPSAGIIDRSIRRGGFSMAGQMFSKNNFKNLFLLFFIICQFGAIVSDSHIWDWGVYLALNILIVLCVQVKHARSPPSKNSWSPCWSTPQSSYPHSGAPIGSVLSWISFLIFWTSGQFWDLFWSWNLACQRDRTAAGM